MLGWLPPLRLLMGFLSPNRLLLFLGLTMVVEETEMSFLRPLVRSLERSLILVRAPLGLSGGRLGKGVHELKSISSPYLVALELAEGALAREVLEARVASEARFVLLADRPGGRYGDLSQDLLLPISRFVVTRLFVFLLSNKQLRPLKGSTCGQAVEHVGG